jgi:Uncharacterized protein conserved in bacteria (DUF2325)
MGQETLSRRKLWAMTCESIFQILSSSLAAEEVEKLCHKYRLPMPAVRYGKVALYQAAHKQCHHDVPFSRQIQRYLNRKHAAVIRRFVAANAEQAQHAVKALLTTDSPTLPAELAGVIWAIASDPRAEMRPIEQALAEELHLRSHCLLLDHFRASPPAVRTDRGRADAQYAALAQETARLRAERQDLQGALTRLAQQAERLRQDNTGLQSQLQELTTRYRTLQNERSSAPCREVNQGNTRRACRKLQYQVEKLTAEATAKKAEIRDLQTRLAASVAPARKPEDSAPPVAEARRPIAPPPPQTLQGKKIALIGGLDGAAAHYEHIIAAFGGDCLLHTGNQGQKKLVDVIKQADIVFCPVDCNSHMAAVTTKKLCRRLHKSCYFLRSSGLSHLKEMLREIASGP